MNAPDAGSAVQRITAEIIVYVVTTERQTSPFVTAAPTLPPSISIAPAPPSALTVTAAPSLAIPSVEPRLVEVVWRKVPVLSLAGDKRELA